MTAQDVTGAAKLFNSAVKADKNDGKARFYLGVALNRLNLHDLAYGQFQASRRLKQIHRDLGFEAGWAAQATGRNKAAITLLEPYVKNFPKNAKAHEFLGRAYARTNQLDKAEASLRKALNLNPRLKPTVLLVLSQIAARRGNTEQANQLANQLLREAPDSKIGEALNTSRILGTGPARRPTKPWSAYVATTVGHNDNVIGFSSDVPLPVEITSKSSGFLSLEGGGEYAWRFGQDQTVAAGYGMRYDVFFRLNKQDVFDNNFYARYQRAVRQLPGSVVASILASYGRTQVDGDRFRDAFSVRPSVAVKPADNVGLEFFFARTMSDTREADAGIPVNSSRDADLNSFGGRAVINFPSANMAVSLGLARLHNNADGSDHGYRGTRFSVGARLKLFEDYTVNAQYTKTDYRYTAPHSLAPFVLSGLGFAFARDDDVAAFKLQVSRPITDRVSGFAKFDFTDTTSNIPLFTYSQTVFGAGVLARF
ncbi:MAG: tetratricopeptide repeat protein [Rhodospirillaceae bacterium]|nr:tetratricopeptide repeat protein [Rhodospirillaceae bacterium]MBT7760637.1 tetratricopeptide repeat protein [Rhodospirillaceae bacterium]